MTTRIGPPATTPDPTPGPQGTGTPTASIVIPHYGDPALAGALVAQLHEQVEAPPFEIIVSDDHSPCPFPDSPGVRTVRREVNGGFGANVNTGAQLARGEVLVILNSDIWVPPTFVRDMTRACDELGHVICGPATELNGQVSRTAGAFPRVLHHALHWSRARTRLIRSAWVMSYLQRGALESNGHSQRVDWITGSAMALRLSDFTHVGGFDETFFMFGEETDLQFRLAQIGVPAYHVGSVVIRHDAGASTPSSKEASWRLEGIDRYFQRRGKMLRYRGTLTVVVLSNLVWDSAAFALGRPTQPWVTLRQDLARVWRPDRVR